MTPHAKTTWNPGAKLIVAHADPRYRSDVTRRLRLRGMEVFTTSNAAAVHALTYEYAPSLVVLDTNLADESGPLVCAKLKISHPDCKVILVGRQLTGESLRLARFVGADAYIAESEGLEALVKQVCKTAVETAC
jgi:DNA-binding NarL/FixJ family response regulator